MTRRIVCCCLLLLLQNNLSQAAPDAPMPPDTPAFYPSHWWAGMKDPSLQLMIHGSHIGDDSLVQVSWPGVQLRKVRRTENHNYLFLDLTISATAKPGMVPIRVGHGAVLYYPLKTRRSGKGSQFAQGVRSEDLIYFLMPDRWSNGDPGNDRVPGLRDQSLNRDSIFLRHGGDFQGIIDHLDYLQGLGVTTLWMTPVLLNDMPDRTEHGYAFTDHYRIEPRLGGAPMYRKLSDELHRRGMKLIQDAVYNHVGLYHFLVQDLPARDWLHQWPSFTRTTYKDQALTDPHAAASEKKIMVDGWFTPQMPDLNQGNPSVARFLIQHAIWCVEEFGVDGWRIDTYMYCDLDFMNRCNKALTDEYPRITLFGEAWASGIANQAYFADNNINTSFKSNLQGVLDFQALFNGIDPAVNDTPAGNGLNKLYSTLGNDFLYKDPTRNVIFLDNHDMTRWFSRVGENVAKQKMGMAWLLTARGIPQLYYGTEVLMKGVSDPDGWVRLDFPGGWKGDKKNAFTGEGLNADEAAVQQLMRTLGRFRKNSSALKTGGLMQYAPRDGLYVYFRYDRQQTILCAMNGSDAARTLDPSQYAERTGGFKMAKDIVTGKEYPLDGPLSIPPMQLWILELKK